MNAWAVLGAVLLPTVTLLITWLDTRDRLTRIETQVKPMWAWFTKTNGNGDH